MTPSFRNCHELNESIIRFRTPHQVEKGGQVNAVLAAKHALRLGFDMSTQLTPEKALIFRIVHRDNFIEVVRDGCHCRSTKDGKKYVEIGNAELIEKRKGREVPGPYGGTLSDYVPFYFTPYSPMLYNIKTGYNGVTKRPMSDILILVSSLHKLKEQNVPFMFSDRHAYLKTAEFSKNLGKLKDMIIWPVLQARNFRKDDVDRFEKYQAEALVYKHVPLSALIGVACCTTDVRNAAQELADSRNAQLKIVTKPEWYL